jgi:hypothetical protein
MGNRRGAPKSRVAEQPGFILFRATPPKDSNIMDTRKEISYGELRVETDRSMAILSISWLDDLLESSLRLHFRQPTHGEQATDDETSKTLNGMFDPERPLGAFSAKCKMAYLLHIVGPITFADLKILNSIRNDFAHHVKLLNPQRKLEMLSFSHNTISNKARNLKSKTTRKVFVAKRANDSKAAQVFRNAVDGIGTGLRSYIAALEEFHASPEGARLPDSPLP